jgi:hypothetical protein
VEGTLPFEMVALNIAGGMQNAHHLNASFPQWAVKDDVIPQVGAAETRSEFMARMTGAIVPG